MKKTVLAAGSILALVTLWYVGPFSGHAQSQNPQAAQPSRTRIALLNLTYVIKNYEKYKQFEGEMKSIVEPFQKKDTELRQQLDNLSKEAAKQTHPGQTEQRDALEERLAARLPMALSAPRRTRTAATMPRASMSSTPSSNRRRPSTITRTAASRPTSRRFAR